MQGIRYLGIPFSLYKRNKAECNPRKNEGAATAQVLKILVSVVRFRPGPPRIYLAQRPLMQVGVFVCQTKKSLCPVYSRFCGQPQESPTSSRPAFFSGCVADKRAPRGKLLLQHSSR